MYDTCDGQQARYIPFIMRSLYESKCKRCVYMRMVENVCIVIANSVSRTDSALVPENDLDWLFLIAAEIAV